MTLTGHGHAKHKRRLETRSPAAFCCNLCNRNAITDYRFYDVAIHAGRTSEHTPP